MCCTLIKYLDETAVNDGTLDIGYIAPVSGIYSLVVNYLQTKFKITTTINLNDPIKFLLIGMNENYSYQGYVLKPDGTRLLLIDGAKTYDCVYFRTYVSYDRSEIFFGGGALSEAILGAYYKTLTGTNIVIPQSEHGLEFVHDVTLLTPQKTIFTAQVLIDPITQEVIISSNIPLDNHTAIIY